MALFVDFIGLNTLIQEPVNVDTNTVGSSAASRPSSGSTDKNNVINEEILKIPKRDYLAALNSHRNGPYGYPVFKQLRTGESPILRRQRLTNIFSHYEYPGQTLIHTTGKDVAAETFINYRRVPKPTPEAATGILVSLDGIPYNIIFISSGTTDTAFGQTTPNMLQINVTDGVHNNLKNLVTTITTAFNNLGLTNVSDAKLIERPDGTFIQRIRSLNKGQGSTIVKTENGNVPEIRVFNRPPQSEKIRHVVNQKRGPVEHFSEVPVVSKHRPLRVVGSVTSTDEKGRESLERVQVYTTLGNETQYFSNPKINKFFNAENVLAEDYEDFVDLYLEGGIDGDESPLDEFRFMQYKQVVYPKELYTYKNHTRNRINFISRYWRDNRLDRTSIFQDNGFGFRVISQSAWVLDGEENFRDLSFVITPGNFTIRHPNTFSRATALVADSSTTMDTGSLEAFTFKTSGVGGSQRSISFVGLNDSRIAAPHASTNPRMIQGYGGWPDQQQKISMTLGTKTVIAHNPYDAGTGILRRMTQEGQGLRGAFEFRGFKVTPSLQEKFVNFIGVLNNFSKGFGFSMLHHGAGLATSQTNWRTKTTASTISTWLSPPKSGPDRYYYQAGSSDSNLRRLFPSGTLYHEIIGVTGSDGSTTTKISKAICFDPLSGDGAVVVKLGTVFTASHDGSIHYCGANEPGAIEYRTAMAFGADNPIFKAAKAFNADNDQNDRFASAIAATSVNHFLFELNLSGSRPDLGFSHTLSETNLKHRGAHFRARHGHENADPVKKRDPTGYAKVYVNASASFIESGYDPYKFLSGSEGNFQQQLRGGNTSLQLADISSLGLTRSSFSLVNTDWTSINPFTAQGFSFSYWIKFGENPNTIGVGNLIYSIKDGTGNNPIIDHKIGGNDGTGKSTIQISFAGPSTNVFTRTYSGKYQFSTDTWYQITFSAKNGGTNMDGVLQVRKKGQTSPETITSTGWTSTFTYAQFSSMDSSGQLHVLPANAPLIGGGSSASELDNFSFDSLLFFNGGLDSSGTASDQFNKLINTTKYGEPYTVNTADFPATDSTTALKAVGDAGTLIHGRKTYELNTFRATKEGSVVGRQTNRGDRYYPFGRYYKADEFQSGVLGAGDNGEFDMSFWFRSSHENYRNRSIRNRDYGSGTEQTQRFGTNITKRENMHKGLFISFWYRKNNSYSSGVATTILKCANDSFGISVNMTAGGHVTMQRRLMFWTKGQGVAAYQDRYNYFLGPYMPDDTDWHYVSVYWNGKSGPEQQAAFQIDDAATPTFANGGIVGHYYMHSSISNALQDSQPLFRASPANGSFIEVLNSPDFNLPQSTNHSANSVTGDSNIAQLVIISNPTDPYNFTNDVRNTLYNNGQFKLGDHNQITTALNNAAVNYGTALIKNTAYSNTQNVQLTSQTNSSITYNRYKVWRFTKGGQYNQYFKATAASSTAWAPAAVNQAGGYTLSFYFRAAVGTASQWKSASSWKMIYLVNASNKRVFEMYKGSYNTGMLQGFVDFGNGQTTGWTCNNLVDEICDGSMHHIIMTYNGRANGSGKMVDFKIYVDGVEQTIVTQTDAPNANSTSANLYTPTKLYIGTNGDSGYSPMPYTWELGAVKLFKQALPDNSDILGSLRYTDRGAPTHARAQAFLKDPQWYFPTLAPQSVSYTGGTLSGVNILGPIVDCMISPDNDLYGSVNTLPIQNRANKTPVLEHYYRLGQEPEIRETPIGEFNSRVFINNTGSSTHSDAAMSISSRSEVASGPKHWNLEWYSSYGDVDASGVEQSRNSYQQQNQQLFYIGDVYNSSIPRTDFRGIELYLTSSGGGYAIESAIARNSGDTIKRTADDLIVPNKWYHLYASYSGCKSGGTPALNLYINGQLVSMSTISAGGGTFDLLEEDGSNYIPVIGGASGQTNVRNFSGYFQDIAFWNKNDTTRAKNCRNVYDGIRAGSSYIDLNDSDLEVVHKTGFLAGESASRLTKVGGSHTMDGTGHAGLVSTDRAFVTGPPIEIITKTGTSATAPKHNQMVIAFWANMSTNSEQNIISFHSDAKFPRNHFLDRTDLVYGDDERTILVNPADNSGHLKNDQYVRFQVAMQRQTNGRNKIIIRQMNLMENADMNLSTPLQRDYVAMASPSNYSTSLVHNVLIIDNNSVRWYENGTLRADQGYSDNLFDAPNHRYTIGGDTIPRIINGWNNITVMSEEQQFKTNSILDEVAILFYDIDEMANDTAKNNLASSLYNGGAVYNYNIRKDNLYAWWRMGENVSGTPITVGTTINAAQKINDDSSVASGKPVGAQNHLYNNFSGRLQATSRASGTGLDIKNYYKFDNVDDNNSSLPDTLVTNQADSVGGKSLTLQYQGGHQGKWSHGFSYDSYELHPLNWLACEGNIIEGIWMGDKTKPGLDRLYHDYHAPANNDYLAVANPSIFSGVSNIWNGTAHVNNDKTKAQTIITFESMPVNGESLIVIMNPKNVAGNTPQKFIINFNNTGVTNTSFSVNDVHENKADINILNIDGLGNPADTTTIAAAVDTLLSNEVRGLDDDDANGNDKYIIAAGGPAVSILAEDAGGDGKFEVIARWNGTPASVKISSVIGYSHISKALTRAPNFGWVDSEDSDFSRVSTINNISTNKQGLNGEHGVSFGTSKVKPYWSLLQTYDGTQYQGAFSVNRGPSGNKFNINVNYGFTSRSGIDTAYSINEGYYLDSGSTIQFLLDNTPALDFNDITIARSNYFNLNTLPAFSSPGAPKALIGGKTGARARFGPGLLQNSYNQFAQTIEQGANKTIDPQLSASACYFRRHSLTASTSFVAPNSGFLQKLSASHNLSAARTALVGNMSASHLFLGSAKWEAGEFAGTFTDDGVFIRRPKKPFYDTYKEFIADARPIMKDYGIVPEFRISDHITDYLRKGPTQQKLNFLNITGGLASADSSDKKDFYEIYSTTDFLKHFEVVQEDHADFVDPFAITLRCNVVKKFLPYEGFYPAQRSVQVAQQFYSSYSDNINVTASTPVQYDLSQESKYPFQYLLNPLFSPGIMFNTIKSGVAVDYPLVTDTGSVLRSGVADGSIKGGAMISEQFDTRIPFEALIEPEKHLANITLAGNEPDENANTGLEVEWGGQGDPLYNLMVSNFLAETSEFFLENKSFTSLASLSQGDANFGNAQKGNIYMMRLKMFRSTRGNKPAGKNHLSKSYGVPQDQGEMTEAFTMYSRPSAFGPPQYLRGSNFTALTWADFKFDGTSGSMFIEDDQSPHFDLKGLPFQHDFSYVTGSLYGNITNSSSVGNQAHLGYNFPFTPPYYHGEAWADITFIPKETKKYSLQEIINQSSVEFYRYFAGRGSIASDGFSLTTNTPTPHDASKRQTINNKILNGGAETTISHVHDRTVVINDQAMQIASSVNIFSQGVLEQDITAQGAAGIGSTTNVQVDTDIQNKYRWIIQTKFETPMLNFNHYTYGKHTNPTARNQYLAKSDGSNVHSGAGLLPTYTDNTFGIELPGVGPQQTPIGMWHQYGHLPQSSSEGVFLQVDDVPNSWIRNAMNRPFPILRRHKSLASLCGFSTDPVRMGEVAGVKEISEAVVAIPFFEKGGVRRFFRMKKEQIDFALDPSKTNLVGRTVRDMVDKMQRFVIPPSLDFVANREIKPFSMYIFEFTHNLSKQDLADIWQNLPPELNETVETDQATISHQLLAYELLGKGGNYRKGVNSDLELIRNERDSSVNPEIQWMVFKVKQRAKTNYFEKIFARNESQQLLAQRLRLGVSADALGRKGRIGYNWPYDFFSMIEGVKMTAEVNFLDFDEEASQQQEKPVIKPKSKSSDQEDTQRTAVSRRMFGALSGLVPPQELRNKTEVPSSGLISKKGKITRPRRVQININNIRDRIKQVTKTVGGKKIT